MKWQQWQKMAEIVRNKLKFSLSTQLSLLKNIQQIRIRINYLYGFLMKLPEVEE